MSVCAKCNEEVTEGVLCSQCRGYLHFSCSGVLETTYRKMTSEKRENWRCISCRNTSSQNIPNLTDILKEIKDFRQCFDVMKSDIKDMKVTIQDLASQWKDVNSRLEVMEGRLDSLELATAQISTLQKDLNLANTTIKELRSSNTQLLMDNEKREQFARKNNLEISGVPIQKGENLENILSSIYTKVGLSLDITCINYIHRVRRFEMKNVTSNRPPAIIVCYIRQRNKDQLLASARTRRGMTTADIGLSGPNNNIYISDHLTPANKLLLKRARELKIQHDYKYIWVRDCKIFVRKSDTSKAIRISSDDDLKRII